MTDHPLEMADVPAHTNAWAGTGFRRRVTNMSMGETALLASAAAIAPFLVHGISKFSLMLALVGILAIIVMKLLAPDRDA